MTTAVQEAETEDRALGGPRRMLNEKQVLQIVPVGRTTLYRMEKTGRFPRSTYISPNRRVWFEDEIVAWQNAVDDFNPNRGRGKGRRRSVAAIRPSATMLGLVLPTFARSMVERLGGGKPWCSSSAQRIGTKSNGT
jgi:prophage regulatory protein